VALNPGTGGYIDFGTMGSWNPGVVTWMGWLQRTSDGPSIIAPHIWHKSDAGSAPLGYSLVMDVTNKKRIKARRDRANIETSNVRRFAPAEVYI